LLYINSNMRHFVTNETAVNPLGLIIFTVYKACSFE